MKKLNNQTENIQQILFLDIETCALKPSYSQLTSQEQLHWDNKSTLLKRPRDKDFGTSVELFYQKRAGIYAEFARIVCISVGYVDVISKHKAIVITKSFFHINESNLLNEFASFLNDKSQNHDIPYLCGHNVKEFDIPFICRRMIINNIKLPKIINLSGKKPWQVPFIIDTLEMWKFGDYKSYISLDLLCNILSVKSSKNEMSGSDVHAYFWEKKKYAAICEYCELDVFTTALIYMKLKQIGGKLNIEHQSKTELKVDRS